MAGGTVSAASNRRTLREGRAAWCLLVVALVASVVLASCADGQSTTRQDNAGSPTALPDDEFGQGVPADLGIYLTPTIDDAGMTQVMTDLLHDTTPGREGRAMIDGVHRIQGDYGRRAIYVDFDDGIEDARVNEILDTVRADPSVSELRRDVVVGQ